jgi:hypothetical protein
MARRGQRVKGHEGGRWEEHRAGTWEWAQVAGREHCRRVLQGRPNGIATDGATRQRRGAKGAGRWWRLRRTGNREGGTEKGKGKGDRREW